MKINIVSKKLIKPCIPTPQNLKNYNISFTDKILQPINMAVVLFYPTKPKRITDLMEESLANILVQFYPLAGRYIKKDYLVDCSDEGAEFVEAVALDVELIDLMAETEMEKLGDLLPRQYFQTDEAATNPLLSIQTTELKCGGVAVAITVSHRIFDASSFGTFVAAWSHASNPGEKIKTISPSFDSLTLFPCKKQGFGHDSNPSNVGNPDIVVKRLSFSTEAIMSLKSKLGPNGKYTSRVRVVCALIAKALIRLDRAKYGNPRGCLILQAVNMRERTIPPLPKHSCGNLVLRSVTRCIAATETENIGIQELVSEMGDAIEKSLADCAEILSPGRDGRDLIIDAMQNLAENLRGGELNFMAFTDWSKFGFYKADFGWGKPVRADIRATSAEKMIALMDNKEGDGIEAWVYLNRNDMPVFERDHEIKLFTT